MTEQMVPAPGPVPQQDPDATEPHEDPNDDGE